MSLFAFFSVQQPEPKKNTYKIMALKDFTEKLRKGCVVAGLKYDNILVELLQKHSKIDLVALEHVDMRAFNVLLEKNRKNIKKHGIFKISPVYIRKSDAEINLKKKRGKK